MPRNTLRTWTRLLLGGMTALAAALPSTRASASFTVVPAPEVAEATAAYRYANMSDVEAYAELDKRKIPYKKADPIPGVLAPVRLTGKLHGVWIHSSIPESQRPTSVYEVLDARLALALDEFAKILERHDIEEVVHYSLYRPNVPREDHDVKEARGPTLAAALKADGAESKATASLAKAPVPEAKAAPIAGKPASAGKGGHPSAPVAKPGAAPVAKPGTAPVAKPGTAPVAKPGAASKPNKPAPAKPPAQAKAQAPKAALPQLPNKALPQLPTKSTAPVHGAKHKAPVVIDKPALPATKGKAGTATATPTTTALPATAPASTTATTATPHPKTTANKAATPARARAATPAKPAVAPQKGAKPAAPAKASSPATAPVSVKAPAATVTAPKAPSAPVSRQTWAAPGTRHPAGLAIDVALLKKRDGQWISVTNDFHGKIGAKTCGDGVRAADTPEARELRSLVCEANDQGVFTYVLTPNYNAAHFDHFHMEIRPQVKWFLYH